MTNMNTEQEKLLDTVKNTYDTVVPVLQRMLEEYEYAIWRAKKPIRDAIEQAREGGVPMSRIVNGATDMRYAQKLEVWLRPHDAVVERALKGDAPAEAVEMYTEVMEDIKTVSRNPRTGEISVHYAGKEYSVSTMGSETAPWSSAEEGIPAEVYDLILQSYPGFVLLDDEGDDDE